MALLPVYPALQILCLLPASWVPYSLASKQIDFHNHRSPPHTSLPDTSARSRASYLSLIQLEVFESTKHTCRLTSDLGKIQKLTQPASGTQDETNNPSPAASTELLTHLSLPQLLQQITQGKHPIPNSVPGSRPPPTAVFSTETMLPPVDDTTGPGSLHLEYPNSSSFCFSLLFIYKVQADHLQSCAWSFLMAPQLVTGDVLSLA